MGTEKFIAFKEDGTAYRLKGRILRFLDNEPVSEDDKTNIRSTLSVPASGEGLTPANNLSDLSNVATARTNLEVNSKDEDAQANALKVTAPALYFSGSSYIEVSDDDRFSFTDGTEDLPFSISAFVKMKDASLFVISSKYGSSNATREWSFYTGGSDFLTLSVQDTSGNIAYSDTDVALTSYEGKWIHVAATCSASSALTARADDISLFINGEAVAVTAVNNASYGGMSNTSAAVRIGRGDTPYAKGHIRDVKIFNRTLTASEVAELARGNDLGFADEFGGALGGAYSSDFSAGVDGWTASGGTADGNIDTIGPGGDQRDDNLRLTVNSSNSGHYLRRNSVFTRGKRYRIYWDYYIPSTNSDLDGLHVTNGTSGTILIAVINSAVTDAWTRVSAEFVANATSNPDDVVFSARSGESNTFQDAGGDDVLYIRNVTITEIGTLADFRAEDYNESASKLLDRSSNNFVGVGTFVTLTGNQRHISADTIDLKNLPTSSAGLSAGEVWSNGGVLTVV